MHYWRALKASKFNVVHCDLSAAAAWLCAALCLSDMKRAPLEEAWSKRGGERGLKDHSEEFLCHIQGQAFHISCSVEGAKLPGR